MSLINNKTWRPKQWLIILVSVIWSGEAFASYTCNPLDRLQNSCRHLVKLNPVAGLGQCLPEGPPTEDFTQLFERNNIKVYTGRNPYWRGYSRSRHPLTNESDPQMVALARVVEAFDRVGNGKMDVFKNANADIRVVFARSGSSAKNSRRIGREIQLTGGTQNKTGTNFHSTCEGKDNHGLIAHELGHYVGAAYLTQYRRHMKNRKCKITSYANKDWSEQFAEVIAAYVTMPQKFAQNNDKRDCQKAFEFMKQMFGEPNMQMTCNARFQSYRNDGKTFGESLLPPPRSNSDPSLDPIMGEFIGI